jgi:hypothetical protein
MNTDYAVTCINGFRRGGLTETQATQLAQSIVSQWAEVGCYVQAHIYWNRTGSLVRTVTGRAQGATGNP